MTAPLTVLSSFPFIVSFPPMPDCQTNGAVTSITILVHGMQQGPYKTWVPQVQHMMQENSCTFGH